MVAEMNRSDAVAALKVLADTIVRRRKIEAVPRTDIYETLNDLRRALKAGDADIVSLRIDEYLALEPDEILYPAFVGLRNGVWAEEYLLLTHSQSGIRKLGELKGKRLIQLSGRRTGLAGIWIDTVLREEGFSDASRLFADIKESTRLSGTVLPVFFKQADVCLVTQSGFKTMATLNPQVDKQLNILRASPPLLPSLICIRRNLNSSIRGQAQAALGELHLDSAGQQVLTLFSLDRLVPCADLYIESALKILRQHQRAIKAAGQMVLGVKDPNWRRMPADGSP
jgi:hypothetical protein